MGFRNFLIGFIKNLVVLLVATLIFSSVTLELPVLVKNVFGDIFAYASPEAQKQAVGRLAESCSALEQGQELVTISQICANRTLFDAMKENCNNYRELKGRGIKVENEAKVVETCQQIESGEIERACDKFNSQKSILPDFSSIGTFCRDYKSGKINDREFFFSVIGSSIPTQMKMPSIGVLDKYNNLMNYLNDNKIVYFALLAVLLAGLYLLTRDGKRFLSVLSGILLSLGLFIMLPYFAILAYDKFVGIDTTPLLTGIFSDSIGIEPKAIVSVVLLLFLRTYNAFIITIGIVFLAVGTFGKTYEKLYTDKPKHAIKKKDKKMEKLAVELRESMKSRKKS